VQAQAAAAPKRFPPEPITTHFYFYDYFKNEHTIQETFKNL
jgi:hypothetical protein